ncbi:MAG: F0F1 ATP synthase subunit A [bacterium]
MEELPSFLDLFGIDMHQKFWGLPLHDWLPVIMSVIVALILVLLSLVLTRNLRRIPTSSQAFLEMVVERLETFVKGLIGPEGVIFLPFIGSLFIYILLMNLFGIIPLMHSATDKLSVTLGLALVVFFCTHYVGIKGQGAWGYLRHLIGEPWWLFPIMFPVHLIGEIARPISLSLRLFGNITGEHTVTVIFIGLSPVILGFIPLPVQLPMVLLGILFSFIQALIFATLAGIYIAGAIGATEH